jgi:RNA polymerase sigma factor (sigma-70 family)
MDSDGALLQRYAEKRDANAFAELVRRHAGHVYGASLRVTGNPHDAEDVAQECFMSMAHNAGSIRSSLTGWLHTAATHRGTDALRRTGTRRRCETQSAARPALEATPTWAEVGPHVDEAFESIPESLRIPLILHYIQGRSQAEIASELGIHQSTVSRRLERGLEVLRAKLKAAGVVGSAAVIGSLLTANSASAAPASLGVALGKMAMAGVGAGPGTGASAVAGTTTASAASSGIVKAAAITAVAVGVAVGGVLVVQQLAASRQALAAAPLIAVEAAKPERALRQFHLSGRVLLPGGRPAVGAKVEITLYGPWDDATGNTDTTEKTAITDAEGSYDFGSLAVPMVDDKHSGLGHLIATLNGYGCDVAQLVFERSTLPGSQQPRTRRVLTQEAPHDLKLDREVVVGATVHGPDGNPLEGVKVRLVWLAFDGLRQTDYEAVAEGRVETRTDAEGRFRLAGIPASAKARCDLTKEGYVTTGVMPSKDKEADFTLPLGGAIEGKVVYGDTGEPAPNLRVDATALTHGAGQPDYYYEDRGSGITDQEGKFRIADLPPSSATVGVHMRQMHADYTAERATNVPVRSGETTSGVVLTLIKGGTLKGAVVDAETGTLVAGATVGAIRLGESYGSTETNAEGHYSLRLPPGAYSLQWGGPEGYFIDFGANREEMPTVTLLEGQDVEVPLLKVTPAARITVMVLKPTGEPAAGVSVAVAGDPTTYFTLAATDSSGRAELDNQRPGVTLRLTARNAEGTLRGQGQIRLKAGDANELVIALKEAVPCPVTGIVVDPDGRPIAGADVAFYQPNGDGVWMPLHGGATTDGQGRFEVKDLDPGAELYLSVGAAGYGHKSTDRFLLRAGETHDVGLLTLVRADKELKGRVVDAKGDPVAGRLIVVDGGESEQRQALTDKDGGFHFRDLVDEELIISVDDGAGRLLPQRVRAGRMDLVIRPPAEAVGPQPPTGIHAAALAGNRAELERLLAAGGDVNAQGPEGRTPLHYAAEAGRLEVIQLLLAKGANVNAEDPRRRTALHLAAQGGHREVAEALLKAGAEVNATDFDGWTPTGYAMRARHQNLADLLARSGGVE